ncbi:MAG: hypothetical protein M0006_02420 [Magnetospirillum sp.]|nr:hypothetical protein [Magnetospirillum sp.]
MTAESHLSIILAALGASGPGVDRGCAALGISPDPRDWRPAVSIELLPDGRLFLRVSDADSGEIRESYAPARSLHGVLAAVACVLSHREPPEGFQVLGPLNGRG